ncbi:cutinase family protein [Streptomyces sp. NPDC005181]|uniref:cutinase family protein n=1 Tax=Streptomyces sp. NPDC005181 TaxID=3156869 RepID=UPI0033BEFD78
MIGRLARFFGATLLFFGVAAPHSAAAVETARQPTQPIECRDIYFFGGHGLGEGGVEDWGETVQDVFDKYLRGIRDADPDVAVGGESIGYPRTEFPDWVKLVRERFSNGQEEVINGAIALNNQLTERYRACPNEHFVLAGYSEGAWVIHLYLKNLGTRVLDRIAGVALLGDPQYRGTGVIPKWYSNHAITPYFSPAIEDRVASWCVSYDLPAAKRTVFDPVCHYSGLGPGSDLANCQKAAKGELDKVWCPHLRYVETGGTKRAADFLVSRS